MTSVLHQNNHYGFQPFDIDESELWQLADQMISTHFVPNDKQGAHFEAFVTLLLREITKTLNLDWIVTHNQWTPKAYRKTRGKGYDIQISQPKQTPQGTVYKPLLTIECKHFIQANPYISPKQFATHILSRFTNALGTTKVLITKGIQTTKTLTRHLTNNNITHVFTNYTQILTQLIIDKLTQLNQPTRKQWKLYSIQQTRNSEDGFSVRNLPSVHSGSGGYG